MKAIKQHKYTCAVLLALLFLTLTVAVSFLITSVLASPTVTIEQNGPRIIVKISEGTASSYKWMISDAIDGEFRQIDGETGNYYDISASDENKYIKAVVDGTETEVIGPIGKLVTLDIGNGSITFDSTYSYYDSDKNMLTGKHEATNIYVIVQDNDNLTNNKISFNGIHTEGVFDVTIDGVHMGSNVSTGLAPNTSTTASYDTGVIDIYPSGNIGTKHVILRIKGENIVRGIHYSTKNVDSSLKITDINGDGGTEGILYIPIKVTADEIDEFVNSNNSYNHWNSAIGGDDGTGDQVTNFEIAGSKLQVLTTYADNCTAIGAGGNGYCQMKITGGQVIAHCNGTGAAIGGGIGWFSQGGKSDITISGGTVYAENHSKIYAEITAYKEGNIPSSAKIIKESEYDPNDADCAVVGGVAIGSGSTFFSTGSEGVVTITGGYVEAYAKYGNGIGGGNSSSYTGGKATITISGGTVIASSIGGGDSKNGVGGEATVSIGDNKGNVPDITLTQGIGGGKSLSGDGGNATITVYSGNMTAGGIIGGGDGGLVGNGGTAKVSINDGYLTAASIGGGTGGINGNGGAAEVYVNNGTIVTGTIGGGDTLNETDGKIGYAKAIIKGGNITGQFLMAEGGTELCYFEMSGGTLSGVNTSDNSKFTYKLDGAAVNMDDSQGIVKISGGTIMDCSAQNGGAIYMTNGVCTISGNATIKNCNATENGGAIYMGGGTLNVNGGTITVNSAINGGAAYVFGGDVYVTGGFISNNTASENGGGIAVSNGDFYMIGGNVEHNTSITGSGGGIYVESAGTDLEVCIYSGSLSHNDSNVDGGALAVRGASDGTEEIKVQFGVKEVHYDESGNPVSCDHDSVNKVDSTVTDCPLVTGNHANESGGAIFVTGNSQKTKLNIYCLEEKNNTKNSAEGDNAQSNFMMVEGGNVIVSSSEFDKVDGQNDRYGKIVIESTIYVTGGEVDIYGEMTNPKINDVMTIDITKDGDHFEDHRLNTKSTKLYKLRYYENFRDPETGLIKGQYKEYAIVHGQAVPISGNIYSHPGYTIKKWNTRDKYNDDVDDYVPVTGDRPNGVESWRGWYEIGQNYTFDGEPIGDLTIFAIWEENGYTVSFDPNVPANESYSGEMANQIFYYDNAENLSENKFKRPGYIFLGWSEDPGATVPQYEDKQSVINLTTEVGVIVKLYAVWEKCDHNEATHTYTYSVIENGPQSQTLRRVCDCDGCVEEVHLSAEDTVYNQKTHSAKVVYTSDRWKPDVIYAALDARDVLVFDTDVKKYLPYHAGRYTAQITDGGKIISVTYTIKKADQPAPSKPSFITDKESDGSVMSIFPIAPSPLIGTDDDYKSFPEYRIVYYENGGEKTTDWVKGVNADALIDDKYAAQFILDKALTNYYIQARYSECDNYKASPIVVADSIYFFAGNVEFIVVCGEGVHYIIKTADGSNVTENGIEIRVDVIDGYFFPKGYSASISTANAASDANLTLKRDEGLFLEYSISNIPANCTITLTLPDAKKQLNISSNITEKQVFGSVTADSATISRDSAFTVRFDISNYDSTEFNELELKFGFALPVGTTIIMQDKLNGRYYYYLVAGSTKSTFKLTEFSLMGVDSNQGKFVVNNDMSLQFVVDFSRASSFPSMGDFAVSLEGKKQDDSRAQDASSSETVSIKEKDEFSLSVDQPVNGMVGFTHNKSDGIASKWDGREDAIVFTPIGDIPADAHLSIVCEGQTIVIYPNNNGDFVYSMPDLEQGTIKVTLMSSLLENSVHEFKFKVNWIVANSLAELSPMNAEIVKQIDVLKVTNNTSPTVSLKIRVYDDNNNDSNNDQNLFDQGTTVKLIVEWKGLAPNYTLKVDLMRKTDSGEYTNTGVSKEIQFTNGDDLRELELSLAGNMTGSYCLVVTAKEDLVTMSEAVYYLIIK